MINALVTKNGQSVLISLPAKRIGLARDLASIGVASPPSELYPHDDELTVGLKYFGTDDFSGRLITLIQSEDSLARVNTLVELYGDLPVAQREKVKASVLSGEMTSLNDFKNSILENKSPEIVQNYYCPLMCTLYLRNRYGDLDYDPVESDLRRKGHTERYRRSHRATRRNGHAGLRMDVRFSRSHPHQGQTGGKTRIFRQ